MQLKINNKVIDKYTDISVSLRYDAVASGFSTHVYFDPSSSFDRQLYIPGGYNNVQVSSNGETLITGVVLSHTFISTAVKELLCLGGYSRSGVIQDCQTPAGYQTQFIGMSLKDIARNLCAPFGLNVIVEEDVRADANSVYTTNNTIEPGTTIAAYLAQLCNGKNIVFSHDEKGNLVLTRANVNKDPIYSFNGSQPATRMTLTFDGQQMHSKLWAVGQANFDTDNSSQDRNATENPYVQSHPALTDVTTTLGLPASTYETGYRPGVYEQSSGNDNTTPLTARQYLSQELKAITLTIEIDSWTLGGKLVRPNNIITVVNPDLFLYAKSRWFIESVDLSGTPDRETAILVCRLPECFSTGNVENIFTGSNLTVAYSEPGAKAVITPFI